MDASGGNISYSSGRTIHTFTTGGTLVCPEGVVSAQVLVVGGGGGGGYRGGGGGGAGGFVYNSAFDISGSINVTIGLGGLGGTAETNHGVNGTASSFGTITANGGGGGGSGLDRNGNPGASGGGGNQDGVGGIATQGNDGGDGYVGGASGGGGGGGAGTVGADGLTTGGGNGGNGSSSTISGGTVVYAGGGGGGCIVDGTGGTGGTGGGGNGSNSGIGSNGTANRGGGGGGGYATFAGGQGGSGVVIISYVTGFFNRSDYGIKVTIAGKDVSSTTPTDFILNSKWATIKILQESLGTITVGGTTSTYGTISHNAGFYPLVMIYSELTPSSGKWYAAPFGSISSENTYISSDFSDSSVGTSTFIFKIINNTLSSKDVRYQYYVIGETGK